MCISCSRNYDPSGRVKGIFSDRFRPAPKDDDTKAKMEKGHCCDCAHNCEEPGHVNSYCLGCKKSYFPSSEAYHQKPDLWEPKKETSKDLTVNERRLKRLFSKKSGLLSDSGWVPRNPVLCDEFGIWISLEKFPAFVRAWQQTFPDDKGFEGCGHPVKVQENHVWIGMEGILPEDIDLEKLYPKNRHMHPGQTCSVTTAGNIR